MAATVKASAAGLQQVDQARRRKQWNKYEQAWYQLANTSESTLKRFWAGKQIQADIFENLCKAVDIENWQAIADLADPPLTSSPMVSSSSIEEDTLDDVIVVNSQIITLEEAIHRFDVSPIIKRFGTWAVTTYGVECLTQQYFFELERVEEPDWIEHMQGKTWVNMSDFTLALLYARQLNKVKQTLSSSDKPLKVFLWHSSVDKPAVRWLYYWLTSIGIEPWLDEEKLLPGQDSEYESAREVCASDVVIVCLSHKSINDNNFVQNKLNYVVDLADEKPEGKIFLVPARLDECVIPEQLRGTQGVDLFKEEGFERLIKSFSACIAN